jgi:hypothetical protein
VVCLELSPHQLSEIRLAVERHFREAHEMAVVRGSEKSPSEQKTAIFDDVAGEPSSRIRRGAQLLPEQADRVCKHGAWRYPRG